jgi:hypothetical protein
MATVTEDGSEGSHHLDGSQTVAAAHQESHHEECSALELSGSPAEGDVEHDVEHARVITVLDSTTEEGRNFCLVRNTEARKARRRRRRAEAEEEMAEAAAAVAAEPVAKRQRQTIQNMTVATASLARSLQASVAMSSMSRSEQALTFAPSPAEPISLKHDSVDGLQFERDD